jgi:hypothetical protein
MSYRQAKQSMVLTARALLLCFLEGACHRTGATGACHLRTLSDVRMQHVYQGYLDIEFVGIVGVSLHSRQETIGYVSADERNHLSIYVSK